jgi:hypothetical protein
LTTEARLSARWIGPSWATAARSLRDIDEIEFRLAAAERAGGFGQGAGEEIAAAAFGGELAVVDDDASAAQHGRRPAFQSAALIGGVADIVVQHLGRDDRLARGIPDGDVGVAADRDRALLRVEAVELRVVGRGQCDEFVEAEPALLHAFGEEEGKAQFEAGDAVGDLVEPGLLALRQFAAPVEAVGRVVGGEHLEGAVPEPGPHRLLRGVVARRRAAAEFGALDARLRDVVGGQEQILRAGLAMDLEPLRLGVADDLDRLGGRDVDNEDRHVEQLRQADGAVRRLALGEPGVAYRVVARRAEAALQEARRQPFDHLVVLGVDHDERAFAPRQRQNVEHLPVVEPQQVVGHVDLERGVAVANEGRQFLPHHLLRGVGDDQVEGIVDDRLGLCRGVILLDDLAQ